MRNKPPMTMPEEGGSIPHLLGTDPLGRDELSRLIFGGRVSLAVGLLSVAVSGSIGTLLGLVAGFYRGHAEKDSLSRMNITFRLPSEELEKQFVKDSTAAGLDGLKGHRSVGGLRASIYNAFPEQGVRDLVQFMREFEKKHG